jgi:hypothetical protein
MDLEESRRSQRAAAEERDAAKTALLRERDALALERESVQNISNREPLQADRDAQAVLIRERDTLAAERDAAQNALMQARAQISSADVEIRELRSLVEGTQAASNA